MIYTNSTDYTYKGYDITIYQNEKGYTVDVKNTLGELIKGWIEIGTFLLCGAIAQQYIDDLQGE